LAKTLRNRPDLLDGAVLGNEDRQLLEEIQNDPETAVNHGHPFAKKP